MSTPLPEPSPQERGAALMARIATGDAAAFQQLYDKFGPSVMRFLARLVGDRTLAEDLTQDTFVRVWGAAGRWEPRARVRTWIFEIARRLAWNALAKRHRRRALRGVSDVEWAAVAGDAAAPDAPLQAADLGEALERAMRRLSPRLRLVFVLVSLEGCSLRDAAAIAGIPVGTVKSRTAAAREALRRLLEGWERSTDRGDP